MRRTYNQGKSWRSQLIAASIPCRVTGGIRLEALSHYLDDFVAVSELEGGPIVRNDAEHHHAIFQEDHPGRFKAIGRLGPASGVSCSHPSSPKLEALARVPVQVDVA